MRDWMQRAGLTLILLATSSCIHSTSLRCLFDKGEEGMALTAVLHAQDRTSGFRISYWRDGFVEILVGATQLRCHRLAPEVHRQVLELLEGPHVAVDREIRLKDAFRREFGRLLIWARFKDSLARPTWVWWGADLDARPGHVETLDEIFCVLEGELPALRRAVADSAPEFLEARGRDRPCEGP